MRAYIKETPLDNGNNPLHSRSGCCSHRHLFKLDPTALISTFHANFDRLVGRSFGRLFSGLFSDRLRSFLYGFGLIRIVFGSFRIVFRSFSDDSTLLKKKKSNFNWPGLGPEPGRPPSRPEPSGSSPGHLKSAALRCSAQACQTNML